MFTCGMVVTSAPSIRFVGGLSDLCLLIDVRGLGKNTVHFKRISAACITNLASNWALVNGGIIGRTSCTGAPAIA